MEFINVPLISQPINWLIVILMLAIAVWGLTLLDPALGQIGSTIQAV
jgi:hypothetical protein